MPAFSPNPVDPIRVERALARLPQLERDAFLLKVREGLTYAAVGEMLGLSPEAAEARVVRALIKLDVELMRSSRRWWRFW